MDCDLIELKNLIVRKFVDKGLSPSAIFKIIQYLARSIFIDPTLSLFDIKEALYHSNLPLVDLDDELFQNLKECLIREGRKGLEYRFGKGFSFLNKSGR